MLCFIGGRQTGKTTKLIQLARDTGLTILAPTNAMAKCIKNESYRTGTPVKATSIRYFRLSSGEINYVLADELDSLLYEAFGIKIAAATIQGTAIDCNEKEPDLSSIGFFKLLKLWRKSRKKQRGQRWTHSPLQ